MQACISHTQSCMFAATLQDKAYGRAGWLGANPFLQEHSIAHVAPSYRKTRLPGFTLSFVTFPACCWACLPAFWRSFFSFFFAFLEASRSAAEGTSASVLWTGALTPLVAALAGAPASKAFVTISVAATMLTMAGSVRGGTSTADSAGDDALGPGPPALAKAGYSGIGQQQKECSTQMHCR